MKKLSTFLSGAMAILLAGSACTQRPSNTYVVHGILPDSTSNGDTIYLYDREAKLKIDSAVITNNSFTCTGQVDTAQFIYTAINPNERQHTANSHQGSNRFPQFAGCTRIRKDHPS